VHTGWPGLDDVEGVAAQGGHDQYADAVFPLPGGFHVALGQHAVEGFDAVFEGVGE
jgi:hypothetical protein